MEPSRHRSLKLALVPVLLVAAGCGGAEEFKTAAVRGKVLCAGQPVSGGTIHFAPIPTSPNTPPGKAASGTIQSDGTFVLGTYETGDGAVVGRHRITAGHDNPSQPWDCVLTSPLEFDVTPEGHELVIELAADGTGTVRDEGQ